MSRSTTKSGMPRTGYDSHRDFRVVLLLIDAVVVVGVVVVVVVHADDAMPTMKRTMSSSSSSPPALSRKGTQMKLRRYYPVGYCRCRRCCLYC